jgi:formylglycine-generating enzyme required for sulfatase activity
MNGVILSDQEQSQQRVDRFVRRFQPSYRRLAYYAALPLVLTPELLNYLRNRFLRGEIDGEKLPWVAEVDLLLSDLCRQVGYEQYVMDAAVQAYLMAEMEQVLGLDEMERVARLLISYVNQLAHTHPTIARRDRQSQRWAAMFYLVDQRDIAVREMAEAYSEAIAPVSNTDRSTDCWIDRHEALCLARLTEKLAPHLAQHPGIVAYGRLVKKIVADPSNIDPELLSQLDQTYRVLDIELPSLSPLLAIPVTAENLSSTDLVWKTFEFEVVTVAFDGVSETAVLPRPNFNFCSYTFEVATIQEGYQAIQTAEIALKLVENLFAQGGQRLTEIEELVLRGAIDGQTYREIAALVEDESLDMASLQRQVGNALWKRLAKILGEKVTKTNVLEVLNRWDFQRHVSREQRDTQGFVEDFGNGVVLDLVQIPGGTFLMGSPEAELDRYDDETLHEVTIAPFLLGRYTITQAQWRLVAGLPQVNRELNPEPSYFKGKDRPVEQVSWEDAVEFCDRLSQHTNREYRLPSEAEWEYACRAGTTTPFHFGETIATDLVNYNGTDWEYEGKTYLGFYGMGSRGEYRKQTTDVGIFPANAFGLYDMHGNVWEWCLDHWHDNYEGAPTDGSAWLSEDKSSKRLLRGGSWFFNPRLCRSAVRVSNSPDFRDFNLGFRVLCLAARTL